MDKGKDARWNDLVERSSVIDGACLKGVTVRSAGISQNREDVVLCPSDMADERLRRMQTAGHAARTLQVERVFFSRAFSRDALTATAMLVRAVVSAWTAMRGQSKINNEHEKRAVALAEAQLDLCGISFDDDILSAQRQISRCQIKPPTAHNGPHDVVAKAIEQISRQIGDRHVILIGESPMAS